MDVVARVTGHRHRPGLCRVVELAVAAAGALDCPAIVLQNPQQLANLHSILCSLRESRIFREAKSDTYFRAGPKRVAGVDAQSFLGIAAVPCPRFVGMFVSVVPCG